MVIITKIIIAREFLAVCTTSALVDQIFTKDRGMVNFKRGRLVVQNVSTLMT